MRQIISALLLILGFASLALAVDKDCIDKVELEKKEETPKKEILPSAANPELDTLAAKLALWVKKNEKLPTVFELSFEIKKGPEEVEAILTKEGLTMSTLLDRAKPLLPTIFSELREKAAKEAARILRDTLTFPTRAELAKAYNINEVEFETIYGNADGLFELGLATQPHVINGVRVKLVRAFTKLSKETLTTPTLEQIAKELGTDVNVIKALFGEGKLFKDLDELEAIAMKKSPGAFKFYIDDDLTSPERKEAFLSAIKMKKRLVVTTAIAGSPVNRGFFDAIMNYCKLMDAELVIIPANMVANGLDPLLLETPGVHILTDRIDLNKFWSIRNTKILPKQINPDMGLERMGTREQSFVFGTPRQTVKIIPTVDNYYHPHHHVGTGAISDPIYDGPRYVQGRTDEITSEDHVIGAVVLEKSFGDPRYAEPDATGNFGFRHIEYIPEQRGFMDITKKKAVFYTADKATRVQPEAIVFGDMHVGETNQRLLEPMVRQVLAMKPKKIILHDLWNGDSTSRYDNGDILTLAAKHEAGKLDIALEAERVRALINAFTNADSSLTVVVEVSNHNGWLNSWVRGVEFNRHERNVPIGAELLHMAVNKKEDPLEYLITHQGLDHPKRVVFNKVGQSDKVGPEDNKVELAFHGHKGSGGSRGSLKQLLNAAGRIVFGHTHTYSRYNGAVNIGTFSERVLPYSKDGLSNWVNALGVVGPNGEIQVLEFQNGEWYSDSKDADKADQFFEANYPRFMYRAKSVDGVGQIDQYSWSEK